MNQGSIPVAAASSATLPPARSAWCTVDSRPSCGTAAAATSAARSPGGPRQCSGAPGLSSERSEEHTSELQSHSDLVCRLLLEKKNLYYRLVGARPFSVVLCDSHSCARLGS